MKPRFLYVLILGFTIHYALMVVGGALTPFEGAYDAFGIAAVFGPYLSSTFVMFLAIAAATFIDRLKRTPYARLTVSVCVAALLNLGFLWLWGEEAVESLIYTVMEDYPVIGAIIIYLTPMVATFCLCMLGVWLATKRA